MPIESKVVQPFDLQLFADESDTTTQTPASAPDTAVQPQQDTAADDLKAYASADQSTRVSLMNKWEKMREEAEKDPDKKQEPQQPDAKTETTPTPTGETPDGEQPAATEPEQPKPYTAEEIKATDLDKLDYKRLPPELVPFYNSMRAAQTKSAQELADQKKVLKEIAADLKPAPVQQQQQVDPAQRFTQRHEQLKGAVAQAFKMNPADLGDDMQYWPPAARLAYDDFNTYLRRVEDSKAIQQQEAVKQKQQLDSFTVSVENELRAVDPEAYDYTINRITTGDVLEKDKQAIIAALQSGEKKTVVALFDKFRREFYGETKPSELKETKKAPEPPNLETGGQGKPSPTKPGPKLSEYRGADQKTRIDLMRKWGLLE
jgi:hypothetical protein